MHPDDILLQRLYNQQIALPAFERPEDIVQWLTAMQAQEYARAKWAIALRGTGLNDRLVEQAFNEGRILRTHLMRPTWHFVHPADIRWMLQLTAPRVHQANAYYYKQLELDAKTMNRCNKVITKALTGQFLTRAALKTALEKAKINADGLRLAYIVMYAELEGVVCSGPRLGKQFTYALLEERAPAAGQRSRKEALALFAERYFTSRGPATVKDFSYWSGLTMKEAQEGAASLPAAFEKEKDLIFKPVSIPAGKKLQTTFLMPDYDEYGMSYKDRSAILPDGGVPAWDRYIVCEGKPVGGWRKLEGAELETELFTPLPKTKMAAVDKAIEKFHAFLG